MKMRTMSWMRTMTAAIVMAGFAGTWSYLHFRGRVGHVFCRHHRHQHFPEHRGPRQDVQGLLTPGLSRPFLNGPVHVPPLCGRPLPKYRKQTAQGRPSTTSPPGR